MFDDLAGATVVVAASGPSQRRDDIDYARGRALVIAINSTWLLCPWAYALYACGENWWRRGGYGYGRHALRVFEGRTVAGTDVPGVDSTIRASDLVLGGRRVSGGGNSALQAAVLVAAAGAARIVLTGCDCTAPRTHWHGMHPAAWPSIDAETWVQAWGAIAPLFGAVEVVNASRRTALTCFPRLRLGDAL